MTGKLSLASGDVLYPMADLASSAHEIILGRFRISGPGVIPSVNGLEVITVVFELGMWRLMFDRSHDWHGP